MIIVDEDAQIWPVDRLGGDQLAGCVVSTLVDEWTQVKRFEHQLAQIVPAEAMAVAIEVLERFDNSHLLSHRQDGIVSKRLRITNLARQMLVKATIRDEWSKQ